MFKISLATREEHGRVVIGYFLDNDICGNEQTIIPPVQLYASRGFHYWCAKWSAYRTDRKERRKSATRTLTFDLLKEKQLTFQHVSCYSDVCQHNPLYGLKNLLYGTHETSCVFFVLASPVRTVQISKIELDKYLNEIEY
jgi:hypothetical protein